MKRYSIIFAAAAVLFAGCQRQFELVADLPEVQTPESSQGASDNHFRSGVINVYLSEELSDMVEEDLKEGGVRTRSKALNSVAEEIGATSMTRLFPYAGEYEPRTRKEGLHRWYVVEFDEGRSVTRASEELGEVPGIEIVEPVRKMRDRSFNDPNFHLQWDMYNDGSLGTAGCDINVKGVWENYTVGDSKVIVSVVDGGIDQDHEDLKANCIGGYNFVKRAVRIYPHDHGTHVGGTIAAVNNNGKGVCGIAGGDYKAGIGGVSLLNSQVFMYEDGRQLSAYNFEEAIKWGADHGAVISQNSWGPDYDGDYQAARRDSEAGIYPSMKDAIDYFIKYAGCDNNGNQNADSPMKGGVFIMAAGNDNWDVDIYCEYPPVIAVGAIDSDFTKARYSNYGDWVDICAPGSGILSTYPSSKYGYMDGTSMACPHVSGVAALIVSFYGGPGFTNEQLVEKLIGGANPTAVKPSYRIGPMLDALGSITYGGAIPPIAVNTLSASTNSNNIHLSWKVTQGKDGEKAYGYMMAASTDREALESFNPVAPSGDVITEKILSGSIPVDSELKGTIRDLEFNQTYYTAVFGYNYNNYYSPISNVMEVVTGGNHAPVIEPKDATAVSDVKVKAFETAQLGYLVSDPDEHDIKVSLSGDAAPVSFSLSDGVLWINIKGLNPDPGFYKVVINVADKYGMSAEYEQKYEILEDQAPEVINNLENLLFSRIGASQTFDMKDYIQDPDGEPLTYSVKTSNANNLKLTSEGDSFKIQATNFGETDVTMHAVDMKGKYSTLVFKVYTLDPEIPVELYPNPVVKNLNVRVHSIVSNMKYSLVSSAGAVLVSGEGPATPFEPMLIDFTKYAPGKYVFTADIDGEKVQKTIIKQ